MSYIYILKMESTVLPDRYPRAENIIGTKNVLMKWMNWIRCRTQKKRIEAYSKHFGFNRGWSIGLERCSYHFLR